MDLSGRVAVITGAGSGIGRELAWACASKGARVVLADIDEAGVAETARHVATDSLQVRCDVSRPDELERLADRTYETFGATHLLVNNAGVAVCGPAL